jgi:Mg-chelatase subunit ChlD
MKAVMNQKVWRFCFVTILLVFGLGFFSFAVSAYEGNWFRDQYQSTPEPKVHSLETTTVLVMDLSGSMADPEATGISKIDAAKQAAIQLLQAIEQENNNRIHGVGLISFREVAKVENPITTDIATLKLQIQQMYPDGGTNISDGLFKSLDLLANAPSANQRFIILLSDGMMKNTTYNLSSVS